MSDAVRRLHACVVFFCVTADRCRDPRCNAEHLFHLDQYEVDLDADVPGQLASIRLMKAYAGEIGEIPTGIWPKRPRWYDTMEAQVARARLLTVDGKVRE